MACELWFARGGYWENHEGDIFLRGQIGTPSYSVSSLVSLWNNE